MPNYFNQRKLFSRCILLSAGLLISAVCSAETPHPAPAPLPQVELKTSAGTIIVELYPDAAPKTVDNFLYYVKSGFYNGTIFHRVINNFMIQGGGMDKDLKEKKVNAPVPIEAQRALDYGLTNKTGVIAMAREELPDTARSQFFINVADNDFLNATPLPEGDPVQVTRNGISRSMPRSQALMISAGYTPFGRVIQGIDVVNAIKGVETEERGQNLNLPKKPISIISAKLLKIPTTQNQSNNDENKAGASH